MENDHLWFSKQIKFILSHEHILSYKQSMLVFWNTKRKTCVIWRSIQNWFTIYLTQL